MNKILLHLLFPLFCFSQFENIKSFQKDLITEALTGSNVALIYQGGKLIYHHIQNSKNPGDKDINNNTIFPIWSMTKPITIVAAMTLVEKGRINLQDPVSKYIPSFANMKCKGSEGPYECQNELKVYHLMTHRSGFRYYSPKENKAYHSTIKYNDLQAFCDDASSLVLDFEPGTKYRYGINQALLGRVIEVASGMTLYDYMKQSLFDPLGMHHTKFFIENNEWSNFQPLFINSGHLKGYTYELDEMTYQKDNKSYFGGEGLVSTYSDYAKFCQMLLNGGNYNDKRIIKESSIDLMTQKHSEGYPLEDNADPDKLGFYYGFSVFVLEDPEVDGVGATAGIFGWSGYHNTHFWIDREKNLFGLFMTRARDFNGALQKRFRKEVYSGIR
jgi:CubicO group peptidase (beta-lactamase class C family)